LPCGLYWKPHCHPGIRTRADTVATARIGAGTPPILTDRGWLSVWHAVEPKEIVGIYRTYWSIMDRDDPSRVIAADEAAILELSIELTRPIEHQMYLRDVVFSTGIAEHGDHYIVASRKADLACRITHIPKRPFGISS
jgi:predicted GH43/DUF377 family glycosyl hydrolase